MSIQGIKAIHANTPQINVRFMNDIPFLLTYGISQSLVVM